MRDKTSDIINEATVLFMQYGLHPVSMHDIAAACGISKKTLYVHFKNKERLIEIIVQKMILKTGKYIRLSTDISPNAAKELENFSGYILEVLEILTPRFIRDLKKYYPLTYTRLIVFRDNYIVPYIERCLTRGITEEIFRPDIKKKNAGWLYCWQIQNLLEAATYNTGVNRIIENLNDLFLHGILNSKGLRLLVMDEQNENARQKEKLGNG